MRNYLAYLLNKPDICGKPSRLMIEPANFCNLHCQTCPVGTGAIKKNPGIMELENFKKIIDENADYLCHITLWNWGEPFLNPKLPEIIAYARMKKIYVVTSTNGHFLDEKTALSIAQSDLNELIIALDGLTRETLSKYRNGADMQKVVQGIKNVIRYKKELKSKYPLVKLQFIVMKHNEHELRDLKKFASDLGADRITIKTFGAHLDPSSLKEFSPSAVYSRYKRIKPLEKCKKLYFGININSDGNIVPCCYDPHESCLAGNAFKEGTEKIWRNEKLNGLRQLPNEAICRNCGYNKSIYLNN